jgi:hypothetical protein
MSSIIHIFDFLGLLLSCTDTRPVHDNNNPKEYQKSIKREAKEKQNKQQEQEPQKQHNFERIPLLFNSIIVP